jgi:hypothetical protein
MQLSFIEFLYVSAQPLHKVKIVKRKTYRRLCNHCLPCSMDEELVSARHTKCCPLRASGPRVALEPMRNGMHECSC